MHAESVVSLAAVVQAPASAVGSRPSLDGLLTQFRIVPAYTDELRDIAFRIRHQVFCEELTLFERRPDRREMDEFDERAVHLLLKHTPTEEFIGCVRVVKGQGDDPSALLPFESVCRDLVDSSLLDLDSLPRQLVGEVSRLGVIGRYRRRKGEERSAVPVVGDGDLDDPGHAPDRRQFPHILIALYLGAYAIAQREGIDYLFTFTELRLFNHLVKLGVPVKVIGGSIHHKGLRVPAVVSVPGIAASLNPYVRAIYGQIVRDLNSSL